MSKYRYRFLNQKVYVLALEHLVLVKNQTTNENLKKNLNDNNLSDNEIKDVKKIIILDKRQLAYKVSAISM